MIICVPPGSRVAATGAGAVQGAVREDGDRARVWGRGSPAPRESSGSSRRRECRLDASRPVMAAWSPAAAGASGAGLVPWRSRSVELRRNQDARADGRHVATGDEAIRLEPEPKSPLPVALRF